MWITECNTDPLKYCDPRITLYYSKCMHNLKYFNSFAEPNRVLIDLFFGLMANLNSLMFFFVFIALYLTQWIIKNQNQPEEYSISALLPK